MGQHPMVVIVFFEETGSIFWNLIRETDNVAIRVVKG
jgi:hypothetical protein